MVAEGPAESLAEESLRRLGRYRVERLIGAGRLGAVFLGRDPILGRPVALRVIPLRAGVRSAEREERLELLGETFRHLGGLAHPNVVTVHDAGIEEPYAYLVMELVPGRDLEATLAAGPLSASEVMRLGRELAAGLDYAHASGVVHGDLRPGSVLVQPSAPAKVVDFGIASALAASRLSHAVSLWDAPAYLAPEALTGPPGPASDQYALALLLYRALTGASPFPAEDAFNLLEAIEHAQPRPPSAHQPQLDAAVDATFARALEKEPRARFAACIDFVESLAAALRAPAPVGSAPFATQPLDEGLRRELEAGAPLSLPRAASGRSPWLRPAILAAGIAAGLGLAGFALLRLPEGRSAPAPAPVEEPATAPVDEPAPTIAEPPPEPLPEPTPPVVERQLAAPIRSPIASPPSAPRPLPAAVAPRLDPAAAAGTPPEGTLRVRLISEGPAGRLAVLLDDELVLAERFQFAGALGFLRRRPRGGELELVRRIPARAATLSVRVELADRIEVIPLRAEWDSDLELTLETRVALDRSVSVTLR